MVTHFLIYFFYVLKLAIFDQFRQLDFGRYNFEWFSECTCIGYDNHGKLWHGDYE